MASLNQQTNLGDLLKYEAPNLYSREQDIIAAGQTLPLGCVVGRETTTAKIKALDPTAIDGTETAIGVLGDHIDATLMDYKDAIVIARHAIVSKGILIWPSNITTDQKNNAIQQLETRGILIRDDA